MTEKFRFSLGKNEKLKGRKTFEKLFSEGKNFSNFPFRVIWMPEDEPLLKAGFVVGTRYFKKATQRNRIRRLMREAYRLQKHKLQHHLLKSTRGMSVVIIYTANEVPPFDTVREKMQALLNRLIKFADESNQSNN